MSLIPREELTTLKSASEVRSVAESAYEIHEEMSIAHDINTAANSGEKSVAVVRKLSESIISKLKSNGYTITDASENYPEPYCFVISWM
nr:MAG TPA: hypothetical protein [Caudoviricetes sp.]